MACATICRTGVSKTPSACRAGCRTSVRGVAALLEPDLAGYALMGAQIELLAALGTSARPRL